MKHAAMEHLEIEMDSDKHSTITMDPGAKIGCGIIDKSDDPSE